MTLFLYIWQKQKTFVDKVQFNGRVYKYTDLPKSLRKRRFHLTPLNGHKSSDLFAFYVPISVIYGGDRRNWHLSYQLSRTVFLPHARGPAQQILHASRGGQGDACMANAAVCPGQVVGGAWLFSRLYCNIFVTLDVMMCTASILNLCAISIDRWVHIHLWLLWRRKRTFFPLLMSGRVFLRYFDAVCLQYYCRMNHNRILFETLSKMQYLFLHYLFT